MGEGNVMEGVGRYDPWVPNPNVQLDVQVDRLPMKYADGGMMRTVPAGRTRIVIEGLDERVQPYFDAVTALVKKEDT